MFDPRSLPHRENGMSTAEYAVGTLGAATIAAILIGPGNPISRWIQAVLEKAVQLFMEMDADSVYSLPRLFARAIESLLPW